MAPGWRQGARVMDDDDDDGGRGNGRWDDSSLSLSHLIRQICDMSFRFSHFLNFTPCSPQNWPLCTHAARAPIPTRASHVLARTPHEYKTQKIV